MTDELSSMDLSALLDIGMRKLAATPMDQIAPGGAAPGGAATAPPMDPVSAGAAAPPPVDPATGAPIDPATGAPIDPAAAGGAPPMDPAAMGMDPMAMGMDPMAMGGMPPGEDPLVKLIEQMAKEISQIKTMVATIADQSGVQMSTKDILDAGEDATEAAASEPSGGKTARHYSDGIAAPVPLNALYATQPPEPALQHIGDDNTLNAAAIWARLAGQ